MAIDVTEMHESRERQNIGESSETRIYMVTGTDDEIQAELAVIAESPDTVRTLTGGRIVRNRMRTNPAGPQAFKITVEYGSAGSADEEEADDLEMNFETSGGTQHIVQSLATTRSYKSGGGSAPSMKGAIGVEDGKPQGVDITVPVFSWSEPHKIFASQFTRQYVSDVFHLTGKTNNNPFRGFQAGEVLFLGASGSRKLGLDLVPIEFKFAASKNVSGLTIGDISGIAKNGWEYLWIKHKTRENNTHGVMVEEPGFVYIEKVYEEGDFSKLLIGTS